MCTHPHRIVEGHKGFDEQFNTESATVLARRGTQQLEDGSYQFTRDLRAKSVSDCIIISVAIDLARKYSTLT